MELDQIELSCCHDVKQLELEFMISCILNINFKQIRRLKKDKSIKGIVLSGGPITTTNKNFLSLDNYILDNNDQIFASNEYIDDTNDNINKDSFNKDDIDYLIRSIVLLFN